MAPKHEQRPSSQGRHPPTAVSHYDVLYELFGSQGISFQQSLTLVDTKAPQQPFPSTPRYARKGPRDEGYRLQLGKEYSLRRVLADAAAI